jgi:hypothetical protein
MVVLVTLANKNKNRESNVFALKYELCCQKVFNRFSENKAMGKRRFLSIFNCFDFIWNLWSL